ncbi:MAG TPA: SIS domain-containing protein [Victivallales bacterium]|nr:SIS domain-containing protein [Victivallales bacterium]
MRYEQYCTWTEINQQPKLWLETYDIIKSRETEIKQFFRDIENNYCTKNIKIIFTGSGTSEFVGNTICSQLNQHSEYTILSIAATDIVTDPRKYFDRNTPTILVSCARSGNSPESVAAVKLADQCVKNIYHIFLTCNENGKLAKLADSNDKILSLLMPKDSDDKGFAMTSSFTCMMFGGILVFNINNLIKYKDQVEEVIHKINHNYDERISVIKEITKLDTERIVVLGSSALKGLAQESALKILELSDGKMSTSFDSFLGFRHGPKSIINDHTLIFGLLNSNDYSRQYELDLIKEISSEEKPKNLISLDCRSDNNVRKCSNYYFNFQLDSDLEDIMLGFAYIYIIQIYAFLKSIDLGNNPDNPCPSGEVNRVVKGVNIYPFNQKEGVSC